MDWDQLATVAQLVTGAATLAVAIFLAVQLRLQREDADRAHLDSVRNFDFGNEELLQDLVLTIVGDESTSELYWKAAFDWESLSPVEVQRFRWLQQAAYLNVWSAWMRKRDGDSHYRFRNQWSLLLEHPGQRRFHEKWGRNISQRDPVFSQIAEEVYEELESQAA